MIRRLRKGFQKVTTAQERVTLAKDFGERDNGNVALPLLLQETSHFTRCIVLTRGPLVSPESLLQINAFYHQNASRSQKNVKYLMIHSFCHLSQNYNYTCHLETPRSQVQP